MHEVHYQDTSRGPCEAPWIYAMNELRIDGVEALRDVGGLREGQEDLSNRIARFDECVNLNRVSESLRRIIRLEASVGHGQVAVSLRECHVRVNHCEAGLDCWSVVQVGVVPCRWTVCSILFLAGNIR